MLMNEKKLSDDERARLYCRRLGYVDTRIFATMASKSEFGNFPKLKVLNEDNIGSDLAKHKRGAYKRNDPEEKLVNPPWWCVKADGYGGKNSMGALHVSPRVQRISDYMLVIISSRLHCLNFWYGFKLNSGPVV